MANGIHSGDGFSMSGWRGGALSSLLTLPASSGIKSAQLCTRRQHDSCFLWLGEKHIDSLPQLASFGKRWSVAKILSTGKDMDSRKRSAAERRMERAFKWHDQYFSCKGILTFFNSVIWSFMLSRNALQWLHAAFASNRFRHDLNLLNY